MINFIQNLLKKDFIRDSSLVFIVNNINNVFNYVLVVVAIFYLKDEFGLWTSTAGFLAILSVPASSFMSILTRKVSNLAKTDPDLVYSYYINIYRFVKRLLPWILILGIGLVVFMFWALQFKDFLVPTVAVIGVFSSLLYSINQNFLLGILEIPKYCLGNIVNLIIKFAATTGLFYLGFGISVLPIAILLASLGSFGVSLYFIRQLYGSKIGSKEKHFEVLPFNSADILSDSSDTWRAMWYFVILALFLNIDIVLSRSILSVDQNNQYGIISTFGQIAHFGPVSFSSLIVPYASRDGHKSIFKISIIAVFGLSLLVTLLFIFGGDLVLRSFGKSTYFSLLPLITVYSLFVLGYNLIFICTNYLISRANFTFLKPLTWSVAIFVSLLTFAGSNPWIESAQRLNWMIYSALLCSTITAIYLVNSIFKLNKDYFKGNS